jgi:hypothetical protein
MADTWVGEVWKYHEVWESSSPTVANAHGNFMLGRWDMPICGTMLIGFEIVEEKTKNISGRNSKVRKGTVLIRFSEVELIIYAGSLVWVKLKFERWWDDTIAWLRYKVLKASKFGTLGKLSTSTWDAHGNFILDTRYTSMHWTMTVTLAMGKQRKRIFMEISQVRSMTFLIGFFEAEFIGDFGSLLWAKASASMTASWYHCMAGIWGGEVSEASNFGKVHLPCAWYAYGNLILGAGDTRMYASVLVT